MQAFNINPIYPIYPNQSHLSQQKIMKTNQRQSANPGVIADEKRHEYQARFQKAVSSAKFLDDEKKRKWKMLGHMLKTGELKRAEQLIISKNLSGLRTRQSLEKIKPKPNK